MKKVAAMLLVVALASLSLLMGWAFDHSILPPYGGGRRCYAVCALVVWAIPIGVFVIAYLPSVAKRLTAKIIG